MGNFVNLKLVNRSNDINNQKYVIFQKNVSSSFDELAVAWKVVENLGIGDYHPFKYYYDLQISTSDAYGNFTQMMDAEYGLMYQMLRNPSGDQLMQKGLASSPNGIDILNNLPQGAITANCFRSGRLLAKKTTIAPEQKAVFQFLPKIFIGAATQVEEGELMDSAIISNVNTEISLLGIKSADIIITGGGGGKHATEFQFTLDNIQFA